MNKIITVLLITYLFYSCDVDCENINRTIINNSGKNIEITSYKNHYWNISKGTLSKKILIQNYSSTNLKVRSCPPTFHFISFSDLVEGDSIVINYGDKIKRYGIKINSDRNPFWMDNYVYEGKDFTYILTAEDYTNAN